MRVSIAVDNTVGLVHQTGPAERRVTIADLGFGGRGMRLPPLRCDALRLSAPYDSCINR